MTIEYRTVLAPFEMSFRNDLHALCEHVFGKWDRKDLEWRLEKMPDVSVHLAGTADLVGFKIGYALAPTRYYSWLGGIHPDHRRQGLARTLMHKQHDWIQAEGYQSVETTMVYTNVAMIELNLQAGLQVIGTFYWNKHPRVLMSKIF